MKTAWFTLTQREREVAELVAQGLTNRQIAGKLFISERTAEYHVEQIRNKLGFHARSQIAAWVSADDSGPPTRQPAVVVVQAPTRRRLLRPSLRLAVFASVAALLVAVGGVAAAVLLSRPSAPITMWPARVMQLDITSGRLANSSTHMSAQATSLVVGDGSIWTASYVDRVLTRLNPTTAEVVGSKGLPAPPVGLVFAAGQVWVATAFGDSPLVPFDPKTNQFGQPVSLGTDVAPQAIASGWGSIWMTDKNNNVVFRVDPTTNLVISRIPVGNGPEGIAADSSGVWVTNAVDGTVSRIDPSSSQVVATVGVRGTPTAIAAGPDAIWVVSESANLVVRIDPGTNQHLEIPLDANPSSLAISRGVVWVADGATGRIVRIDSSNDRISSSVSVGGRVDAIASDGQSLWIAVHEP